MSDDRCWRCDFEQDGRHCCRTNDPADRNFISLILTTPFHLTPTNPWALADCLVKTSILFQLPISGQDILLKAVICIVCIVMYYVFLHSMCSSSNSMTMKAIVMIRMFLMEHAFKAAWSTLTAVAFTALYLIEGGSDLPFSGKVE